jgi:uncharacterized protein (TIGR02391 family)
MARNDVGAPLEVQDLLSRAKAIDAALVGAGFKRPATAAVQAQPEPAQDPMARFDAVVTHLDLRAATRTLYRDGYFARAVEEAFKYLCNAVKGRANDQVRDGWDLMVQVFDPKAPVLRLSRLRSTSERDQQAGYRWIFAGVMTGIRNPRAHDHALADTPESALEMLVIANHLMRILAGSTKTTRGRSRKVGVPAPPTPIGVSSPQQTARTLPRSLDSV